MKNFFESISVFVTILNLVTAYAPAGQNFFNFSEFETNHRTAHISPEIINELKDFETLIPKATIDEIAAEHYIVDGNFRTVIKYLRSAAFAQLQKQLLNVPEIVDVLQFLHLTAENATTRHMGATEKPTTLDEYNDAAAAGTAKGIDKMTINSDGMLTKLQTRIVLENAKEVEGVNHHLKVPKRPQKQFYIKEQINKNVGLDEHNIEGDDDDDDDETVNANSIAFSEQQPLVHIVLLEDLEVKAKALNKDKQQQPQQHPHHHKYKRQRYNGYSQSSLGTFTSFVEEVLQHLPNAAYQQMITDKCQKNSKFAQFYQALRSPVFKPYLEGLKAKPNIQNIITTLSSHGMDVNALEAIAFKVISWGPNI